MTPEQYRFLQTRVGLLLHAFDKIHYRALQDEAFRKQFGLLDWEEELVRHDSGFRAPSPTSRHWTLRSCSEPVVSSETGEAGTPEVPSRR